MYIFDHNLSRSLAIGIRHTCIKHIQVHLRGQTAMRNEPVTGPYHHQRRIVLTRPPLFPR